MIMTILIDNGHGVNTPGKCSPDGRLKEYAYAREVAKRIVLRLKELGYDARRVVTEETDISLKQRCQRVNNVCSEKDAKNVLLVSIHCNAACADGKWHDARGFTAHVSLNASARSKRLANLLWTEAIAEALKGNRYVPEERYIANNFAICRDTNCAAVLTENLFQDNKADVDFLLSEAGKQAVTEVHVNAIVNYIREQDGK